MTWVIEVDVNEVHNGPLHGELVCIVGDAIRAAAPDDHVRSVRVRWQPDVIEDEELT